MIISSVPMRISLNGGGSDLPSFFNERDGLTVAMPLNKRVYVTFHESFSGSYRISYNRTEIVQDISEIDHPIVKACLQFVEWRGPGLEIHSVADVPGSGTGLGSSSAFTIALLAGLFRLQAKHFTYLDLAAMAAHIEIEIVGSPIGYQDQYACALADVNTYRFMKSQKVEISPVFESLDLKRSFLKEFNEALMFFHLDAPRSANQILFNQNQKIVSDPLAIEIQQNMVDLARLTILAMKSLNVNEVGRLMTQGWKLKSKLNGDERNIDIQNIVERLETAPIYGAKMLGAGGGGFLAILSEPRFHEDVRRLIPNTVKEHTASVVLSPPFVQRVGMES